MRPSLGRKLGHYRSKQGVRTPREVHTGKNRGRLAPFVVRTLLLFLYGTGLRVRESLALTQADVDLASGVVTVRESKVFKFRNTPRGKVIAHITLV
jgi:integrase/recombinase XerD